MDALDSAPCVFQAALHTPDFIIILLRLGRKSTAEVEKLFQIQGLQGSEKVGSAKHRD